MDIKTKDYRRQLLKSDSKSIKTKRMMKQMTIKSKQSLQKQQYSNQNTKDEGENRYAVNRSEDTAKAATRMGKAYAIKQLKKKVQQKRFEKGNITTGPTKAYGDSFSSNSFDFDEKVEKIAGFPAENPVKTVKMMKSTAKMQDNQRNLNYENKKAVGNLAAQNQKKRVMKNWQRSSLLQKKDYYYGRNMTLFSSHTIPKSSISSNKVKKGIETSIKKSSPMYLMVLGFLLLMVVVVLLFSSAMAVIGEDEDVGDIPANGSIVEVAESQIGNRGGRPYWSWYGFTEHVDWCACFVSWCADKCGYIENGDFPKFSYCQEGVNWFIQKKSWYRRTISPSPGMIIFFDWDNNGTADHVGIVKSCKGNIVRTIESNSGDMCKENWYTVGNKMIMGYGGVNIQLN